MSVPKPPETEQLQAGYRRHFSFADWHFLDGLQLTYLRLRKKRLCPEIYIPEPFEIFENIVKEGVAQGISHAMLRDTADRLHLWPFQRYAALATMVKRAIHPQVRSRSLWFLIHWVIEKKFGIWCN